MSPPSFVHPPPNPRRVFPGMGGVGVYQIWPRMKLVQLEWGLFNKTNRAVLFAKTGVLQATLLLSGTAASAKNHVVLSSGRN